MAHRTRNSRDDDEGPGYQGEIDTYKNQMNVCRSVHEKVNTMFTQVYEEVGKAFLQMKNTTEAANEVMRANKGMISWLDRQLNAISEVQNTICAMSLDDDYEEKYRGKKETLEAELRVLLDDFQTAMVKVDSVSQNTNETVGKVITPISCF